LYHSDGICGPKEETYGQYLDTYWKENCIGSTVKELEAGKTRFLTMLKRCIRMRSRVSHTLFEQARMRLIRDIVNGAHNELFRWEPFEVTLVHKKHGGITVGPAAQNADKIRIALADGHEITITFQGDKHWPEYAQDYIRVSGQQILAPGGIPSPADPHLYNTLRILYNVDTKVTVYIKIDVVIGPNLNCQILNDLAHIRQLNIVKRLYLLVKFSNPSSIRKFSSIDVPVETTWANNPAGVVGNQTKNWSRMILTSLQNIITSRVAADNRSLISHLWGFHKVLQAFTNLRGVHIEIRHGDADRQISTIAFPYYTQPVIPNPQPAPGRGIGQHRHGVVGAGHTGRVQHLQGVVGGAAQQPCPETIVEMPYVKSFNFDHVYDVTNQTLRVHGRRVDACAVIYVEDIHREYTGPLGVAGTGYGTTLHEQIDDDQRSRVLGFLIKTFTGQMNIFDSRTWRMMNTNKDVNFDPKNYNPCAVEFVPTKIEINERYSISNCESIHAKLEHCFAMLRNVQDLAVALVLSERFSADANFIPRINMLQKTKDTAGSVGHQITALTRSQAENKLQWKIRPESFGAFDFGGTHHSPNDFVNDVLRMRWNLEDDDARNETSLRDAITTYTNAQAAIPSPSAYVMKNNELAVENAAKKLGLSLKGALDEYRERVDGLGNPHSPTSWTIVEVGDRFLKYLLPDCIAAYQELFDKLMNFAMILNGRLAPPAANPPVPGFPDGFSFGSLEQMLMYFKNRIAPGAAAAVPANQFIQNDHYSLKHLFICAAKTNRKELYLPQNLGMI